jgi:hypothetical protein
VKELTAEDLDHAVSGGLPAAAIIAFVGYGGAPVNVLKVGSRIVLNNGFHRVYTLRRLGVKEIPVVVQHVSNPQLEFPPQVGGLPKEYLLARLSEAGGDEGLCRRGLRNHSKGARAYESRNGRCWLEPT